MKKFIKSILMASVLSLGITSLAPTKGYADEYNYTNEVELTYEEVMENIDPNEVEVVQDHVMYLAPVIPAIVLAILRIVPAAIRLGQQSVNLSKFTIKTAGRLKDPKSGWMIVRDRGNNPHGGSFYKLLNKAGKRIATLDKNGKIIRD